MHTFPRKHAAITTAGGGHPMGARRFSGTGYWSPRSLILGSVTLCLVSLFNHSIAFGQEELDAPDTVVISPGGRGSTRVTLKGEILEYNGDTLRIRLKLGEIPKQFPASDVVEILTPQASEQRRGLELFNKQDFSGATNEFLKAFKEEPRAWVKREILTYLVRSALKQGDYLNATAKFALLVRSDPRTQSLALIPLMWTKTTPDPELKSQAAGWLVDEKQPIAVRLMGASILLDDRELGATASTTLRDLGAHSDRRIGALATAQLWRTRLATGKEINLTELKVWEQKLESLPEDWRGGPHFLMGRAYTSRREYELGAVHLLWIPLTQPDDHFLAARATFEAAGALTKIGQLEEAAKLYEEIAARYANTPTAPAAETELKELLKQASPSNK